MKKKMKLKYTSTVDYQLKMHNNPHFINLKYDACMYKKCSKALSIQL
jgi:hypothetical protein